MKPKSVSRKRYNKRKSYRFSSRNKYRKGSRSRNKYRKGSRSRNKYNQKRKIQKGGASSVYKALYSSEIDLPVTDFGGFIKRYGLNDFITTEMIEMDSLDDFLIPNSTKQKQIFGLLSKDIEKLRLYFAILRENDLRIYSDSPRESGEQRPPAFNPGAGEPAAGDTTGDTTGYEAAAGEQRHPAVNPGAGEQRPPAVDPAAGEQRHPAFDPAAGEPAAGDTTGDTTGYEAGYYIGKFINVMCWDVNRSFYPINIPKEKLEGLVRDIDGWNLNGRGKLQPKFVKGVVLNKKKGKTDIYTWIVDPKITQKTRIRFDMNFTNPRSAAYIEPDCWKFEDSLDGEWTLVSNQITYKMKIQHMCVIRLTSYNMDGTTENLLDAGEVGNHNILVGDNNKWHDKLKLWSEKGGLFWDRTANILFMYCTLHWNNGEISAMKYEQGYQCKSGLKDIGELCSGDHLFLNHELIYNHKRETDPGFMYGTERGYYYDDNSNTFHHVWKNNGVWEYRQAQVVMELKITHVTSLSPLLKVFEDKRVGNTSCIFVRNIEKTDHIREWQTAVIPRELITQKKMKLSCCFKGDGISNNRYFETEITKVLSCSVDKTVRIWNAVTGECEQTLEGHTDAVFSASFSPDGAKVVSGSADNTVRIWNAVKGECEQKLEGHTDAVNSASFSPDGAKVVSSSDDQNVRIWNAVTGDCEQTLEGHTGYVFSASFSPDSAKVVSGSADNTVRIWDAVTGGCEQTLVGHSEYVNSASFSPDGTKVVSGSYDNTVRIWNAVTGECEKTLVGHSDAVTSASLASLSISTQEIFVWFRKSAPYSQQPPPPEKWVAAVSEGGVPSENVLPSVRAILDSVWDNYISGKKNKPRNFVTWANEVFVTYEGDYEKTDTLSNLVPSEEGQHCVCCLHKDGGYHTYYVDSEELKSRAFGETRFSIKSAVGSILKQEPKGYEFALSKYSDGVVESLFILNEDGTLVYPSPMENLKVYTRKQVDILKIEDTLPLIPNPDLICGIQTHDKDIFLKPIITTPYLYYCGHTPILYSLSPSGTGAKVGSIELSPLASLYHTRESDEFLWQVGFNKHDSTRCMLTGNCAIRIRGNYINSQSDDRVFPYKMTIKPNHNSRNRDKPLMKIYFLFIHPKHGIVFERKGIPTPERIDNELSTLFGYIFD